MKPDSRAVLWLKWKQFKANMLYWLGLIGFDQESSRFYLMYVFGFWLFWVFAMWAFVYDQVQLASEALDPELLASLPDGIPVLMVVIYLIYGIISLFNTPMKFRSTDITYLVTSPVSRRFLTLIHFVGAALSPAWTISLASTLLAMLLTWPDSPDQVGMAGLQAFLLAFPIVYILAGWGWIISLAKRVYFLRTLLLFALPLPVLLLGRIWTLSIGANATFAVYVILLALVALTLYILGRLATNLHLSRVADQSRVYARIQRLGLMGRIYARTVIDRIHRQAQLTRKTHLRHHLPVSDNPAMTLWYRALLSLSRLSPKRTLALVGQGALLTSAVLMLTLSMGWRSWEVWLIIAFQFVQFRPSALIGTYGQDMSQAFLTQFLPADSLRTFITASSFPILIASWGGIVVALLLPTGHILVITALIVVTAIALALCQALELRQKYGAIGYEYSVLFYGILVVGAGYVTASLWASLIAAIGFVALAVFILK